jgi:hypothetical protein
MDPVTIGVMAGLGLAKSELIDRPREERQRQQAANTMRYSPWTGMAPNAIQEADPLGSAMDAGLTGAMLSQNQQKLDAGKAKDLAETNLTGGSGLTSQALPWQMMEMQNQSVDPRLMSRRPMY